MLDRSIAVSAAILATLSAQSAAWADDRVYPYHMMWGGSWFMGPLMMLVFFGVLVVLVVLLVRWLGHFGPSGRPEGPGSRAIAILEERFARGEIDRQEFEEKKRLLER